MTSKIDTPSDIINLWPARRELANDLGVPTPTVHKWAQNESIPPKYHLGLICAARGRGFCVAADDVVRVHAVAPATGCRTDQGPVAEKAQAPAGVTNGEGPE